MAGHSKWAQIKRKKAVTDARRGALFSKLARAITMAARDNPDPGTNRRLADEVARARATNMPGDSIERAIRRVAEREAAALQEITLEIIGPGNAAIIVTAITDNSNRTIGELRRITESHGAKTAERGSLAWMFRRVAVFRISGPNTEELQLRAIDAGAEDVQERDGEPTVMVSPENAERVRALLADSVTESSLILLPVVSAPLSAREGTELEELLNALDDYHDTHDVVTNAEY